MLRVWAGDWAVPPCCPRRWGTRPRRHLPPQIQGPQGMWVSRWDLQSCLRLGVEDGGPGEDRGDVGVAAGAQERERGWGQGRLQKCLGGRMFSRKAGVGSWPHWPGMEAPMCWPHWPG